MLLIYNAGPSFGIIDKKISYFNVAKSILCLLRLRWFCFDHSANVNRFQNHKTQKKKNLIHGTSNSML